MQQPKLFFGRHPKMSIEEAEERKKIHAEFMRTRQPLAITYDNRDAHLPKIPVRQVVWWKRTAGSWSKPGRGPKRWIPLGGGGKAIQRNNGKYKRDGFPRAYRDWIWMERFRKQQEFDAKFLRKSARYWDEFQISRGNF